jgi:hypothetical protein
MQSYELWCGLDKKDQRKVKGIITILSGKEKGTEQLVSNKKCWFAYTDISVRIKGEHLK